MLSFSHPNVMSLIGVCFDKEMPMIIMPFMSNGSVLGYVKEKRNELHFDIEQEVVCYNNLIAGLPCNGLFIVSPSLGSSCQKYLFGYVLSDL